MSKPEIPTYDPNDPDTDFSFDWLAFYEGEDPGVSGNRPITTGHTIEGTSWPREEPSEEE